MAMVEKMRKGRSERLIKETMAGLVANLIPR